MGNLCLAPGRELFVTLGEALRAYQPCDESHPVYERFATSLRAALGAVWRKLKGFNGSAEEDSFALAC